MGWRVASDALPSSSPSLIWLQLGFGLARAVTIVSAESYLIAFLSLQFGELAKATSLVFDIFPYIWSR